MMSHSNFLTVSHFRCPLCRYDAKHFLNLSSHFLSKHDVLQEWIRESLEEMTEQRLKEAEETKGKKEELATGKREVEEEIDTVGYLHSLAYFSGLMVERALRFQSDEEFDEPSGSLVSVFKAAGLDPDLLGRTVVKKRSPHKKFKSDADFLRPSGSPAEGARKNLFNSQRVRAVMTKDICDKLHLDVPHEWICDGRLLLLTDPTNKKNYDLFKVHKFNNVKSYCFSATIALSIPRKNSFLLFVHCIGYYIFCNLLSALKNSV